MIKKSLIILIPVVFGVITCLAATSPARAGQEKTFKVKVAAEQANLRERPDISSAVVQQIPEGTILDAEKKEGEWYLVRYTLEDGAVIAGYIHESLVVVLEPGKVPETQETPKVEPERRPQRERREAQAEERRAAGGAGRGAAPYELSFSAGGASIDPEDLNLSGQGLAGYNGAFLGISPSGSIGTLRLTYSLCAEASYRIMPWLALGVGVDYISGSNASTVRYAGADFTDTFETRPAVRITPVRAIVRFYPGSGFYFRGSLGYYSAKLEYYYRFVQADAWQQWSGYAKGHCFGAEVGVGGDWTIGRGLALFAEAGFRMARVGALTGGDVLTDSTGLSVPTSGPLWYFTKQGADMRVYDLLFIRETKPAEAGVVDARRADLNLSGTTFRAGIRLRF